MRAPRHLYIFYVIGDSSRHGQFVDRKRDSSKQYSVLDTIIQIVSHKRIMADLILVLEKLKVFGHMLCFLYHTILYFLSINIFFCALPVAF